MNYIPNYITLLDFLAVKIPAGSSNHVSRNPDIPNIGGGTSILWIKDIFITILLVYGDYAYTFAGMHGDTV